MEAAVVSAAHGAMGSLLSKLGALLTNKYKLVKEAKGQIMFLKAELESMHAFLVKISDTEDPDKQDKCWAKEVRELSYDIEDSINEFMLRVELKFNSKPHGIKGFMERSLGLLTAINTRHKIAKEFEGLKSRVIEVRERRMRYKVDDAMPKPNNTTVDLRLLALHAETAGLVGIDGPRDELIRLIDEEGVPAHQLRVLSIVGFGGLGKTTLANEIYRRLEGRYQCRAFVPMSQRPNIRKILRTILSQVGFVAPGTTNIGTWDEQELIIALQNFLLHKRYFIFIDDIWDTSAWEIIRCALPENQNGSRVITTTRIETVARACCAGYSEYVYRMKSLNDQDSRRLFFKRIFGSEDACPPYLKEISAKILKRCGGLPLAIITTSSLLASQPNKLKEQWVYILNSLGSDLEVSPSLAGMRQILDLSYIHLPHYLKTCMLYLGIYPEDYTIRKNDLARQWVAEGFVSKVHGADPEDVASSFFNELINRSMIQPIYTDYNTEVIACRVHDMMLDLILHKSREENFITIIDDIQDMAEQPDKIRRLSLQVDGAPDDRAMGSIQLYQTRTLARFGTSRCLPSFQLFKHLRVLTIEISSRNWREALTIDITRICHLFQLKFLKIVGRGTAVVLLPSTIGGLQQLETFEVSSFSESLCKLPSDFVHMSQLLHLIVPYWIKLPDGIGNMKSLRTLHGFGICINSLECIRGLRELTSLTDLKIHYSRHCRDTISRDEVVQRGREVMRACIEKLCSLKYLDVSTEHNCEFHGFHCLDVSSKFPASFRHLQRFDVDGALFLRVPEWISQHINLYDLRLTVTEVLEGDVGMLARLPSLIRLVLYIRGEAPRDKIIIHGGGFPALKRISLTCCRVSFLTFEAGAMAKLERLHLTFDAWGWDRCGGAPAGIQHLASLKEISALISVINAKESNVSAAKSALRKAADMHPGRPTADIDGANDFCIGPLDRMDEEDDVSCGA